MLKNKNYIDFLKYVLIGTVCFFTGLILVVLFLNAVPFSAWKSIDASTVKSLSSKIPRPYIVLSGSMEPAIKTGSIIFSYPAESYVQGDVITFAPNGNASKLVTHRIVSKMYPDGIDSPPRYMTAGDANEGFDSWEIKDENITGKNLLTLPYLGYVAEKAKTPYGFILFVIVPATIIIYEEIKSLLKEIGTIIKRTGFIIKRKVLGKKQVNVHIEKNTSKNRKYQLLGYTGFLTLFLFIGSFLVYVGLSTSLFSDIEKSVSNFFQASGDFELDNTDVLINTQNISTFGENQTVTLTPTTIISPTPTEVIVDETEKQVTTEEDL